MARHPLVMNLENQELGFFVCLFFKTRKAWLFFLPLYLEYNFKWYLEILWNFLSYLSFFLTLVDSTEG